MTRQTDFSLFAHMVVNMARFIRPDEITFTGVNSALPMLACLLAKRCRDFHFTYINVAGGVDPLVCAVPLSSSDPMLAEGSCSLFANEDFYDLCCRGGMDLCFLGAAQVDGEGNTNVSCIGDWHSPKVRLPGGGGAAVMLPTARRAVTWRTEHSPRTLVEKLDFTTAAGGVYGLVTPYAVFEKTNGRLALKHWNPATSPAEIQSRTGFQFNDAAATPTPPPMRQELRVLRALDPEGVFSSGAHIRRW
jgi:glutaconate CoA-transferase subunit B